MEVDISNKVNRIIKFSLAGIVVAALLSSALVWFWHGRNAYLTITDAKVASALVGVRLQAPATIEDLLVADGETVAAGQPLAKLKIKVSPEQISQLEQSLELAKKHYTEVLAGTTTARPVAASGGDTSGAQADLDRTVRNKARMEQLYAIGAVSAVRYEQAQAEYEAAAAALSAVQNSGAAYENTSIPSSPEAIKAAQIQVNQAQLALDTAKKNMESTELSAPVAGTVYYTELRAGSEAEAGQAVFHIGDAANIWIEICLEENQRDKIRLGQFVSYKVGGHELQGTVLELIEPEGSDDTDRQLKAKVSLPMERPEDIKPGLPAVARIALNG